MEQRITDCTVDSDNTVWYFAFGANMHPRALEQRDIVPIQSQAAELRGYKLVFSARGMANVEQCPGESVHGVLHHLSLPHMQHLISIEMGYDVLPLTVYLYTSDVTITANVFVIPQEKREVYKPSERYINLLIEGALHHNVRIDYIENILRKVEYQPEAHPDNFMTFKENPSARCSLHTLDELPVLNEKFNKEDPCTVVFLLNSKFVKARFGENEKFMGYFAGKQMDFSIIKQLHNPKLPPVNTPEDLTPLHTAWAENFILEQVKNGSPELEVIGFLSKN